MRRGRRGAALRTALRAGAAALLVASDAAAASGNLVLVPELPMTAALIVLFVLLVFPANALLFRPIFKVLDARHEKIDGTRERARKIATDADAILERYERAVRETREEAERDRKGRLTEARSEMMARTTEARAEAERELDVARRQIDETLEESRRELGERSRELAREAAARVLGRPL